jgi:hypothetical protein
MVIARLKSRLLRRFLARHRFLLYVEAVLIWLFFVVGIIYGISFLVIPSAAEMKLKTLCGGVVDIQTGRLKGVGSIRLSGVVVAENERALLRAPILQADHIEVKFNPWQLLISPETGIHSVTLSDFLLTADYDASAKRWNLGGLTFEKDGAPVRHLPQVKMQRGAIRVRQGQASSHKTLATVGLNAHIDPSDTKNEYQVMVQTDGRFGFGESQLQGTLKLGEDGRQGRLSGTGRITMPPAGILQNKWDMSDIELEAAFDPKAIHLERFSFSMGEGNGRIDAALELTEDRPVEFNIRLHGLSLSDRFEPGTVSYGWLLGASDSGLARFLKRFNPVGRGEMDLAIKGRLNDLSQARLNGLIECKDIWIRDSKFPYQFESLRGNIEFNDRTIRLKELQARHGDVRLQLDGYVINQKPQAEIDFHVTSPDMRFDEDLYQALSEKVKKVWYDFSPKGLTEFNYHYWQRPGGESEKTLTLELQNASAHYKHFLYPLENLTGRIVLQPQRLVIDDVLASYEHGGQIKITGHVLQEEETESVFDVGIHGTRIPVDQSLIQALPQRYSGFFKQLQVDAMTTVSDFTVGVFPDTADPRYLDYSANIKVKADSCLHEAFPLPMDHVSLAASVTKDAVRLDSFHAETESGQVTIGPSRLWSQGSDPNHPGLCLSLGLEDFELTDTFWDAVDPDIHKKLGRLKVLGKINASGKLIVNMPKAECPENDLIIDCSHNPLEWEGTPLGHANGRLHIQDDRVTFSDFSTMDIPLESLPGQLLPERLAAVLTHASGQAGIHLNEGSVKIGPNGLEDLNTQAKIVVEDLALGEPAVVDSLDGDLRGQFSFDRDTDTWQAEVHYAIDQLAYRDRFVTDLSGDCFFDPNTLELKSGEFTGSFYDGNVVGSLRVNLGSDQTPQYQLELNFDNVDMKKLSAAGGRTPSQQHEQGFAGGRLALEGDLGDFSAMRGTGETTITDLKMGRQSLLGKILTAVQLKQPENFIFNEIDLKTDILGPELIFSTIRMVGTPMVFHGKGRVNYRNRHITLDLAAWDRKNETEETVLEALARGIGSALWKVEVHGTIEDPEVDAVYLAVLKHPLDLFKDDQ